MTDAHPAPDCAAAYIQLLAGEAARDRLAGEVFPSNRAVLFDALAAAAITSVVVFFDGSGDSGQIEEIDVRIGDEKTELPAVSVEIATPNRAGSGVDHRRLALAEAIEDLVYDFLRTTHPGWENNDGAFGEFMFNVADRSISLEHNTRYTEIDTSVHHW